MVIEIQTRPNAGIPFGFADGILLLDLEFTSAVSAVIMMCGSLGISKPQQKQDLQRCRDLQSMIIMIKQPNNLHMDKDQDDDYDDDYGYR